MSLNDFWEKNLTYLKDVGPKRAELLLSELNLKTFKDLLEFYPRKYVDKSQITPIKSIYSEGTYTLIGKLGRFEAHASSNVKRLTTTLRDSSGYVELIWFQGTKYIKDKFKENDEVVIYGKFTFFNGQLQISHPEMEQLRDDNESINLLKIVPQYSCTEKLKLMGLDSKGIRKLIFHLLDNFENKIEESLPIDILQKYRLSNRAYALKQIHFPESFETLNNARKRLKFEELFYFELIMAKRKQWMAPQRKAKPFPIIGDLFHTFYKDCIPFELTGAQKKVIREIRSDLNKTSQMNRLIQGDVGSGKTMVALLSMLIAIDNGFQVALMAPTEILAEQHYSTFIKLLAPLGVNIEFLAGKSRVADRRRIHANLLSGHCKAIIGTHALIEDEIRFNNLGLTIIDEQHKFGVLQRAALWAKSPTGWVPHSLSLTATPIPRTLAMTVYGDVDVSVIDELPPGRKPIKTIKADESMRLRVFGFMKEQLQLGRQIYVVFPLVKESAKLDLLAVEAGYETICKIFSGYRVGIVHGKMKPDAKELEMSRFKKNETQILVSTTVIEVGVDVPNASIMVIENAERFGLSQLHQLRGRVGRGAEQSYTVLMAGKKLGEIAKQRLNAMVETNDGFKISEIDLQLRGPGDFLGTRQSGLPEFKLADIVNDQEILEISKIIAFELIEKDPKLSLPEHKVLNHFFLNFVETHSLKEMIA